MLRTFAMPASDRSPGSSDLADAAAPPTPSPAVWAIHSDKQQHRASVALVAHLDWAGPNMSTRIGICPATANEQKGNVMKKLALHTTLTLVALLAISSVSLDSDALANGGGGIGGEYINGEALATGGDFSCSDPDDAGCVSNSHFDRLPATRQPNRMAHNHKGTEHPRYR